MYLSHLTQSLDNLLSILEIGFVFFPNERKVFSGLSSAGGRNIVPEPQCRGMVSFTDIPHEVGGPHRKRYGHFGIAVQRQWAIQNGACKAIYVRFGSPVFDAFASLFHALAPLPPSTGNGDLDAWLDKVGRTQPEFSKSLGTPAYAELLKLHEYMQTDEDIADNEWRILRPHKFSWSNGMQPADVKESCLLAAKSGIMPTLRVSPTTTAFLICPRADVPNLRDRLPELWADVLVREHSDLDAQPVVAGNAPPIGGASLN